MKGLARQTTHRAVTTPYNVQAMQSIVYQDKNSLVAQVEKKQYYADQEANNDLRESNTDTAAWLAVFILGFFIL